MSELDMAKKAQWWKVKFLKDKKPEPEKFEGGFDKGEYGYCCIREDGVVLLWRGRGFYTTFENTDEARKYATCLRKTENQTANVIDAWNRIVF